MDKAYSTLFLLFIFLGFGDSLCQAQKLPPQEVAALKAIASKLHKKDWDFKVDPCSGEPPWVTPIQDPIHNNVSCSWSIENSWHVSTIRLKGQNLTGVLPDEFANLTFLSELDLTRNYLNGTIPIAWTSLPLTTLSLLGNRISGFIPKEIGKIATLTDLVLEDNQLQGSFPPELGNLGSLKRFLVSANNLTGAIPVTFSKLTSLTDFRIDGNAISGKIPDFIGNWKKLERIDMQGTSLEGPIPSTFSALENLNELRISDLKTSPMPFPPLEQLTKLTDLVLRNCALSGEIPAYLANMADLKSLDVSFNKLTGEIPANFGSLLSLDFMYFTNNMLTGEIPNWVLRSNRNFDLSFNNFSKNPPAYCSQGNVNLVGSFSTLKDNSVKPCLRKNFPCASKAQHTSLFINCGGGVVTVGDKVYEDDTLPAGSSAFYLTDGWAYTSTGDFTGDDKGLFIATSSATNLSSPDQALYSSARLSPLSLKYFGFCLQNGNYDVQLHFAEIIFTDDYTFPSHGQRIFDVSIQGVTVLKDFNIKERAGGAGRPVVMKFTAPVTDNTLEIHFYWAGKGTVAIPHRGVYGPSISAITVTPKTTPAL